MMGLFGIELQQPPTVAELVKPRMVLTFRRYTSRQEQ